MDTNINAAAEAAPANSGANYWPGRIADELEKSEEFRKALKELDAMLGTQAERARKKEQEKKAEEAKEERKKRIDELYAELAKLRSMLASKGGSDPALEGQISAIQTELFWLMFSF